MRKFLSFFLFNLFCAVGFAQPPKDGQVIDKILGVVGERIVLKSEVENQLQQLLNGNGTPDENSRCKMLEEQLFQALLLDKADKDSVFVGDAQVQSELDRRMGFFIQQFGSEERLEQFYEKSIVEIKAELYTLVENQLLGQTMQQKITSGVKLTPEEVKEYYNSIPKDSLPFISSEVELAQIVRKPKISEEQKQMTTERLKGFRERILKGEVKFESLARLYSQDGSAEKGGELGFMDRSALVPEFAAVAFDLEPGQVSGVVETEYGFHLIQGVERRGQQANVRHILITPKVSGEAMVEAKAFLDSIANLIRTVDTLTFELAAKLFSDDKQTKNSDGLFLNPMNGTSKFEVEQLGQIDPTIFYAVDKMEPGEISEATAMQGADGSKAFRLIKLISRSKPHVTNMKDDYQRVQQAALVEKQNKAVKQWVQKSIEKVYVKIDSDFANCEFQHKWPVASQ